MCVWGGGGRTMMMLGWGLFGVVELQGWDEVRCGCRPLHGLTYLCVTAENILKVTEGGGTEVGFWGWGRVGWGGVLEWAGQLA